MLKLVMRVFGNTTARIRPLPSFLLAATIVAAFAAMPFVMKPLYAQDKATTTPGGTSIAKAVGTIKSIDGDSITVAAESGGDVTAKLSASTKIQRVPPGETTLKNATTLQAQDLQPGDRVLVRGQISADGDGKGQTITALSVVVMKQADVSAKQQRDRDDWQKRGVDGLVTKVDAAAGVITISLGAMSTNRSIAVHITKDTVLRRYAPDSVKFDDAKPAPVDRIKAGDQLRARGTKNSDGSEINAEEIVTGAFRNIAGTIKAIDIPGNTITVQDAISKSAVVVKVSAGSQIKKLPAEMAQRFALRLKGGAAGSGGADHAATDGQSGSGKTAAAKDAGGKDAGGQSATQAAGSAQPSGAADSQASRGPGGNGQRAGANGPPDLQRMLSRLPNSALADLHNGDAVIILSTEGADSNAVTAITLVAGVEAILTAAPSRNASSLLSPWSLSGSGGGGEGEGSQ